MRNVTPPRNGFRLDIQKKFYENFLTCKSRQRPTRNFVVRVTCDKVTYFVAVATAFFVVN